MREAHLKQVIAFDDILGFNNGTIWPVLQDSGRHSSLEPKWYIWSNDGVAAGPRCVGNSYVIPPGPGTVRHRTNVKVHCNFFRQNSVHSSLCAPCLYRPRTLSLRRHMKKCTLSMSQHLLDDLCMFKTHHQLLVLIFVFTGQSSKLGSFAQLATSRVVTIFAKHLPPIIR